MEFSRINPNSPSVPGFIWRTITRDNLATLVELAGKCYLVDGGLSFLFDAENLRADSIPPAPGAARGAFDQEKRLVACTTVHIDAKSNKKHTRIVGLVWPDLRNKGIGTYLIQWSQLQAQSLLARTISDRWEMQIATESHTEPADRLYQAHGFEQVFETLVLRRDLHLPLPDRALPPDVTLANWQPKLAVQFYQSYHASFQERLGFPGWRVAEWIA
jgi:GNAT superfamily N-acetyltransferase